MKILHITNSMELNSGGPPRSLIQIVNHQIKNNKVGIISSSKSEIVIDNLTYLNIVYLIKKYSMPNLSSINKIFFSIKNYEIIHIHNWWNLLSTMSLIISFFLKKKIIITPHGSLHMHNVQKSKIKKLLIFFLLENLFINKVYGIHYLTKNELDNCFLKNYSQIKKIVIPNSISLDRDHYYDLKSSTPYYLYIGRLSKNKGVNFLVNVMYHLKKIHNVRFKFLIIGPDYGEKNNLKILTNKLDLNDVIEFKDPIYTDKRLSYLKSAQAVLMASDYECNSIVIAETLSLGSIMICTNECNALDETNYGACITVDKNINEFSNSIISIADKVKRKNISSKAISYSKKYLNLDKNNFKLLNFYN